MWNFAVIGRYFASPVFHTRRFNKLNRYNFILHVRSKDIHCVHATVSSLWHFICLCNFIKHKMPFSWRLNSNTSLSPALCVTFMKFLMPFGGRNLTTSWALDQSLEFIYYSLFFVSSICTISLIQKRVAETNMT